MNTVRSSKNLLLFAAAAFLLYAALICPCPLKAQYFAQNRTPSFSTIDLNLQRCMTVPALGDMPMDLYRSKENRCLEVGYWLGVASGSTMGLLHLYWSANGMTGTDEPYWKNLLTGIPSSIIGAYVGRLSTEWTTRQILKGNPKPLRAALKGAMYGAIDGAIILTAGMIPLFLIGHYIGTISTQVEGGAAIFKLIGMSVVGGTAFGGMIGAAVGAVYGPGLSLYMKF